MVSVSKGLRQECGKKPDADPPGSGSMTGISRRESLIMAAGMVLSACAGGGSSAASGATPTPAPGPTPTPTPTPGPTPTPTISLNTTAAAKGMRFGSAFAWSAPGADAGSFANPSYAALLEADCGVLVPENELKWQAIRPSANSFDFTRFDAMLTWAESKGLAVRGHNLL